MISKVKIGGYDCQDDFGMLLASKDIELPTVQTKFVEVPGRDGTLDFTEALSGRPAYYDRTIKLVFVTCKNISHEEWPDFLSKIANAIHGKRLQIIFDEDPDYYYDGRCVNSKFETTWC